jgi:hypothetical protein
MVISTSFQSLYRHNAITDLKEWAQNQISISLRSTTQELLNMDAMEELLSDIKVLNNAKHSLDPDYIKDVMESLTKTTGTFLRNLYEKETNEESLKKMIDACPASLSFKSDEGYLPIQTALLDLKSFCGVCESQCGW